jgi:hypothetical protein
MTSVWAPCSLSEQVEGDQSDRTGVRRVEEDEQVARAGEAVDADAVADEPLGLLDVEVSRADDHINRSDRVRADCECGDCLGAADPIDLLDAGERTGPQDDGVGRRRRADDHLLDAGGTRGDDAHHDGARVGR